ncbi:cytochrome c biogenesis protein CcsA [Arcobacter cryaerophilus gv. pseudocryaerophilus]|uniref:Cytochrome c biogenesis protein CcsA n=3 Tax=unclassified Arcobacter TaxID=2593671 RepID=A0AA96L149_9BACT|nr:cytochrome c biogenesis protein CcsA [Arcobacter sp. AZ-2023]WPD04953.1 cytochrome c biogenesis protein CcsA [Arcobacter sp. DSM 115956]WPD07048.1 cytochrome c biogenesis protein CcsA [Arcobacter sp. DSM 115955]WNL31313.1 cytochrome c biogenesis protein CcsA [Arcobacter sp. AZ-2023]WNP37463.1 cytochrome c biogenesis protein CcsA [Arcobacter sp. AZ-2023]
MKLLNFLFSFKATLLLLAILAIGAGVATFIENDFGTSSARVLVYNNTWYEIVLVLTTINLSGIIYKFKMWNNLPRFLFHFSFVVILLGAIITRYVGYEGIMQIPQGTTTNQMISLEPYLQVTVKDGEKVVAYKEWQKEFTSLLPELNNFSYKVDFDNNNLIIDYKRFQFEKKEQAKMGLLTVDVTLNGKKETIRLPGLSGQLGVPRDLIFDKYTVTLEYGSKFIDLPFAIRLNEFQLERYPGSMAPSSYASEVTVIKDDKTYDYRIFMNRTLNEGNFLFFQSSYFPDETGTVLSVNNDPGKWPTYFGYFLLTLGLFLNFFDKKSRFRKLIKFVANKNLAMFILTLALLSTQNLKANESNNTTSPQEVDDITMRVDYLNKFKDESKVTADKFGHLVVQSSGGRMKPLATLNREIVQKLSGKSSFMGMDANQIVLGMITRPDIWKDVKIIKINTPKLKKFLGVPESEKYISFSEAFGDKNDYLLAKESEKALLTKPIERGTYEKDIIKVDEKLNIIYSVFNGALLNIFPKVYDEQSVDDNFKWYSPIEAMQEFSGQNQAAIGSVVRGLFNSTMDFDWNSANNYIDMIALYQDKVGTDIKPTASKINAEIVFNKLDIFFNLTLAYVLLGFIMVILAFVVIFKPEFKPAKTTKIIFAILTILFAIQTFGMGYRWYLSGHAPWSDIYETLIYISWSAIFAGVIFFRNSLLALGAATIIAGIFMFTAHLTDVDPQITSLVPVLKSYWLTIHVSILTASYGFFGLSAILGFLTLIMFIFRKNRPHLDEIIKHISAINEISLIIGLACITIGNFLGGVWANESWGRYWGWDPKETWAYVSIVVYALVIHLRFVKSLNTPYVLATASLLAFSSIMMTYLGVNFYLSGMHSYATGDPVPIPMWAYLTVATAFAAIILAYKNRDLKNIE